MMENDYDIWPVMAHVLNIANKGQPKIVFYRGILSAISDHVQVDGIRLCLRDGQVFQSWRPDLSESKGPMPSHAAIEVKQGRVLCLEKKNPFSTSGSTGSPESEQAFSPSIQEPVIQNRDGGFDDRHDICRRCLSEKSPGPDGHAWVGVPILDSENRMAAMIHFYQALEPFSSDQIKWLISLSNAVGIALVNWQSSWSLNERVKELSCLYQIAHLLDDPGCLLEDIFFDVVKFIPSAWLYADSAYARIIFDGTTYALPDYPAGQAALSADLYVKGRRRGKVEVCYDRKKPELDEGPFLHEEKKLLEIIAKELSLIAEGRSYEQEMQELKNQLHHTNRLSVVGQLAASVAHELNEPLTNIMGYAQLAAQAKNLSKQTKADIDKITAISLQARDIIRKLLLFSQKLPLSMEPLDLNTITGENLESFRHRCRQKGLSLRFDPHHSPAMVMADANQLRQITSNLILNAMHACRSGDSILVRIRVEDQTVRLSVVDTGQGMDQSIQERMFTPFFSTKKPGQGTGLGLSVVRDIVDSYHGRIDVVSEPSDGTEMHIHLPAHAGR